MPKDHNSFADHALRRLFERVDSRAALRRSDPDPNLRQIRAFNDHCDLIQAAGIAWARQHSDKEVRQILARAGHAGLAVFGLMGTTVRTITHLPSLEEDWFVDHSMTGPATFVDSAYALAAGSVRDLLPRLGSVGTQLFSQSDEHGAGPAFQYARRLASVLSTEASPPLGDAPSSFARSDDPSYPYWHAQLMVLTSVDRASASLLLDDLARRLRESLGRGVSEQERFAAEVLPWLGLSAIVRFDVASDHRRDS